MAKRAVFAGGVRVAAVLVPVSPLQGFLLVTNRHGPVVLSLHAQGARKKSQAGFGRRTFYRRSRQEAGHLPTRSVLNRAFLALDRLGLKLYRWTPPKLRRRALKEAEAWILERLNGEGGLGAIFPAIVNAYEALELLGYPADHPLRAQQRGAIEDLLVVGTNSAYCQPCVSPVWDTAWACIALQQIADERNQAAVNKAFHWLGKKQLLNGSRDWSFNRPRVRGGGRPFQFTNSHYPDLDDTAAVAYVMHKSGDKTLDETVQRAAEWICGMQSTNGGFAAFDADNDTPISTKFPSLITAPCLDPATEDVSGRCVMLLAQLANSTECRSAQRNCLDYLFRSQQLDGSWFGRWGTNYIYGTWSVLMGLEEAGLGQKTNRSGVPPFGSTVFSVPTADGAKDATAILTRPNEARGSIAPRFTPHGRCWA